MHFTEHEQSWENVKRYIVLLSRKPLIYWLLSWHGFNTFCAWKFLLDQSFFQFIATLINLINFDLIDLAAIQNKGLKLN